MSVFYACIIIFCHFMRRCKLNFTVDLEGFLRPHYGLWGYGIFKEKIIGIRDTKGIFEMHFQLEIRIHVLVVFR